MSRQITLLLVFWTDPCFETKYSAFLLGLQKFPTNLFLVKLCNLIFACVCSKISNQFVYINVLPHLLYNPFLSSPLICRDPCGLIDISMIQSLTITIARFHYSLNVSSSCSALLSNISMSHWNSENSNH